MKRADSGFTLIELSIVLVIIGLIVGGVVVGQSLINAAGVRATITQIEKYNTATNTFRGKYGYLPGDIKDPDASNFGFQARGTAPGEGDGNGVLEGIDNNYNTDYGYAESSGETAVFWVDLSKAGLIEGGFSIASETTGPSSVITSTTNPALSAYFPAAKLGAGNYIFVWSGGVNANQTGPRNGINYFGLANVTSIASSCSMYSSPGLTVKQAFDIDKKIDDGFPQSGRVMATIANCGSEWMDGSRNPAPETAATPASASTCSDNGNVGGASQQYSLGVSNGNNVNCALSFQFQ